MKVFNHLYIIASLMLSFLVMACSDDNTPESAGKDGPKPSMDVLVSPQGGLHYGDKLNLTGLMEDERNLDHYELMLKNSKGDTLTTKYQMLLGKSFNANDYLQIPLPKNAQIDDLTLQVKLDNTRNGEVVEEFDLPMVGLPIFEKLNLILGNGKIIELEKHGDIYESAVENVFPAKIKGIISTTTGKNGIYWGVKNGEVATMASDSIVVGADIEASYTVSFNPQTFEFKTGERHVWTPLPSDNVYYILGTISGHWQDGEITKERSKMMLTGFESGSERYYTWTAPDGEDPETGMWGQTAAGTFRLKKGGEQKYILWDGNKIVESATDNTGKAFPVTAGGPFTIKSNFKNNVCTSVEIAGGGKSLVFSNGKVVVNGVPAAASILFANSTLPLKPGTSYIYEGTVNLKKGQTIASVFDLSSFTCNPDLFTGGGNSTWTLKANSGSYLIRLDAFSGALYACPTTAYPDVIYMDGWSWAPTSTSTAVAWNAENVLPLVKTSRGTYEATFYNFGWGGDVAFYVTHPSSGATTRLPITNFNSGYLNPSNGDTSFKIPAAAGYYKVVIDLKEGVNISAAGVVTPKGTSKFSIDYVEQ
uniref:Uncharacterized protein n=1 Tax=Prevotella sp. GTC17262 TaxID=3236797 RepID=A0AB33JIG4_9BACT